MASKAELKKKAVEAARAIYASDDVEIDDAPKLSRSDEDKGTWVAAWVWVADEESES